MPLTLKHQNSVAIKGKNRNNDSHECPPQKKERPTLLIGYCILQRGPVLFFKQRLELGRIDGRCSDEQERLPIKASRGQLGRIVGRCSDEHERP